MAETLRAVTMFTLAVVVGACGTAGAGERQVVVFAAASLTEAFQDLATEFETGHPGVEVILNLAGSQTLAQQIVEGAPADVFASADEVQMRRVEDAGSTSSPPEVLARNRLAIAVEPGNPRGIAGLEDLARGELVVVLAADAVPAGRYSRRALDAAGVTVAPASFELDVRSVLSKVALGEADAGIVYETDVVAAGGDVDSVPIVDRFNQSAAYPIAVLATGSNADGGRQFLEFVLSDAGAVRLAAHGFSPP